MNLTKTAVINQIEDETIIKKMMRGMQFGRSLNCCGFNKKRTSESTGTLIYQIMVSLFCRKSLRALWESGQGIPESLKGSSCKNCYYRFLNENTYNWRSLLRQISKKVVAQLLKVTPIEDAVLVLDDTPIIKRGKRIELLSTQYNHTTHSYFKGFTQVHLGWSDGSSFIPLDFCVKVGKKIFNDSKQGLDQRTHGARRRSESHLNKLEQSLKMLRDAERNGIDAAYVVFDTWFSKPVFIKNVLDIGYHSVFQLSKSQRTWKVDFQGEKWSLKELYRKVRTEKTFKRVQIGNLSQSIASIIVSHPQGFDLKLVFCRLGGKNWAVFGSTDIDQSDLAVLKTYVKRWSIEPYFKESKQLFRLGKEQSVNFDMQISMTTIRMIAYIFTAYMKRLSEDSRTIGDLFSIVTNDFSKLNLDHDILERIFDLIVATVNLSKSTQQQLKSIFEVICHNLASKTLPIRISMCQVG